MKKAFLFLFVLATLCCAFTLSVFANDNVPEVTKTFYVVKSQTSDTATSLKAEGKDVIVLSEVYASTLAGATDTWLDNFEAGSHIELIFAENIVESISDNRGIVLNKHITLTVRYNGFSHYVTNTGRSNAFVLRHADAAIRFIGTHAIDKEDGSISTKFSQNSNNPDLGNLDIYHGKVYCWIYDGDAYSYNMRTKTGQEYIFTTTDDDKSNSKINNIEVDSCAISFIGIGGDADKKTINFKNSYFESHDFDSLCTGSIIDNCVFNNGTFYMDSHGISGEMLVIKNCKITSFKSDTGRTHVTFIDCELDIGNLILGSDGGGACYALVYKTAGCEDGELNVYKNGKGTTPVNSKDVNNDSKYAQIVIDFYADPANIGLGHSYDWSFDYEGAKYLSSLSATKACIRCKDVIDHADIDALFTTLGYSVPEFGTSLAITVGYSINKSAISDYENLTGSKLNFGCVVALKDKLGVNVAPLDENGEAVALSEGKVIKADITSEAHSYMDLKISLTEPHKDVMLLMSGFIIETTEEGIVISYMQFDNKLVENNQFEYISYNNR